MPHVRFCPWLQSAPTDCKPGRTGSSCLPMAGSKAIVQADIEGTPRRRVQQRQLSRSTGRPAAETTARDDGSNTSHFDCNASANAEQSHFKKAEGLSGFGRWGSFPDRKKRIGAEEATETVGVRLAGRWQEKCTSRLEGSISISEVFR